ncbi:hypothetical protein Tco_0034140 [Tanacetum coccineum]
MKNSKKGYTPMMEKPDYRKSQGAKTPTEVQGMQRVPYASAIGSLDLMLPLRKIYVVIFSKILPWTGRVPRKSTTDMSSTEFVYIAAAKSSIEAVWIMKFINGLGGAMPSNKRPMEMLCDNEPALAITSDPGNLKGAKKFQRKYHNIHEVIQEGEIFLKKVHTDDNVADPFTKPMPFSKHFEHVMAIGIVPASSYEFVMEVEYCFLKVGLFRGREIIDEEMHDAETIKTGKDKDEMTVAVEADVEETAEEEVDDELVGIKPKSKNAKVRVNTEESAVKPKPELKNTIGCNLNPSDGPGKPNSIIMKTVKLFIPSVVNAYLGISLGDSLQKVLQSHTTETKRTFLGDEYTELLKSRPAKSLSEYELKNILYDKMHESQSHLTHDTNQELYDALAWSIKLNENNSTRGRNPDTVLKKIDRESVEETITKVVIDDAVNTAVADVVHDVDQPQDASKQKTDKTPKYNWFTQPPRPPTFDPEWNTVQVVDDAPEEHLFNDLLSAENDPLTFDALMAIPIHFSKFSMN